MTGVVRKYIYNREVENELRCEYFVLNGKKEGVLKSYHHKGTIQAIREYVNGIKHGINQEFNTDGRLIIDGRYNMGKKVGKWKYSNPKYRYEKVEEYDKNGNIEKILYYNQGILYETIRINGMKHKRITSVFVGRH